AAGRCRLAYAEVRRRRGGAGPDRRAPQREGRRGRAARGRAGPSPGCLPAGPSRSGFRPRPAAPGRPPRRAGDLLRDRTVHFRRGLPGLGAHGAARRARPPRRQRRRGPRARSADGTDPVHPRRGPRPPPGPPPADLPQGPPRQGDAAPDLPHRRRDQPPPRRARRRHRHQVARPWVIFQGTLTTARGQIVSSTVLGIADDDGTPHALPHTAPSTLFQEIGLDPDAIGTAVADPGQYQALLRAAVPAAREFMEQTVAPDITAAAKARVERWEAEQLRWEADAAGARGTSALMLATREALEVEKKLVSEMLPERTFVRPLLVVVPRPEA